MKFKVPAKLFKAARLAQSKNDVRFWLNGVLITPAGKMIGTNGAMACIANIGEGVTGLDSDVTVCMTGAIPAKAVEIEFDISDDGYGLCRFIGSDRDYVMSGRLRAAHACSTIDSAGIKSAVSIESTLDKAIDEFEALEENEIHIDLALVSIASKIISAVSHKSETKAKILNGSRMVIIYPKRGDLELNQSVMVAVMKVLP